MKKQSLNLKEKTKTVTMSFSVVRKGKGFLKAKESLNCDCLDGAIRTLPGGAMMVGDNGSVTSFAEKLLLDILPMRIYDEATKTYGRRLVYVCRDGVVYSQNSMSNGYTSLANVGTNVYAFSFVGKDGRMWIALLGAEKSVIVDDTFSCTTLGFTGSYGVGCYYKNRLFIGIKAGCLAYSAPEEPTNFTESVNGGGMIRFTEGKGEIVAILPFRDALYVFFERGIARVDVVGSPKDFKITHLAYTGGTILFRTVGACERAVYFMTMEGVYRFDGEKAERVFCDVVVTPISTTGRETAVAWRGGIIMRYRKRSEGDVLLAIGGDGKECCYLENLDAISGDSLDGVLLRLSGAYIGKLDENGNALGIKYHFYAETDFEQPGRKTLRKLTFEGKGAFTLTVKNGGRTLTEEVAFQDGVATVNLSERGGRYALTFEPKDKTVIKNMTAELRVLE